MEDVDVVFIQPRRNGVSLNPDVEENVYEPVNIGILQAILEEKGISTYFIDADKEKKENKRIVREVTKYNPTIVGISATDFSLPNGIELSKILKEEDVPYVVFGGYGPTFQYRRCFEEGNCDIVVRGEGEIPVSKLFPELLTGNEKAIEKTRGICYRRDNKIIENGYPEIVYNLDRLPFPLRRDIPPKEYLGVAAAFVSSRGCEYGKCNFCSIWKFPGGRIYRRRSPENVIEELKHLYEEHGVFIFGDVSSSFLGRDLSWTKKFFELAEKEFGKNEFNLYFETRSDYLLKNKEVIEEHLNKIYEIDVGIENFDQNVLDRYNKGISPETNIQVINLLRKLKDEKEKKEGIMYGTFFRMFTIDCDLYTTLEEFENHYNTIKKLSILDIWTPNVMVYHPWVSFEEEKKLWLKYATPEALSIAIAIEGFCSSSFNIPISEAIEKNLLEKRAESVQEFFDEFIREFKKVKR